MKQFLQTSTLLALTALGAWADNRVNVPFGFRANGINFPAGEYLIRSATLNPTGPVLRLQNSETGMVRYVSAPVQLTSNTRVKGSSHMVFQCEDQCKLTEVWLASGGAGVKVGK